MERIIIEDMSMTGGFRGFQLKGLISKQLKFPGLA